MNEELLKLNELAVQKKALEDEMKAQRQLICEKHCPVKVGDEVEVNDYSFKGKTIVVDNVFLKKDYRGIYFVAIGHIKKKGGELGAKSGKRLIPFVKDPAVLIN